MRIALCFRGQTGFSANWTGPKRLPLDPRIGYNFHNITVIQPNALAGHQVDIFLHSWSVDKKDQLLQYYQPKKHLIEEQIPFETQRSTEDGFSERQVKSEFAMISSLSSAKKVINLKSQVEKEEGFTYDAVMLLRYDVTLHPENIRLNMQKYDMNCFYYNRNEDYDKKRKSDSYVLDYWFFTNSNWMNEYGKMADLLLEKYDTILDKDDKRGGRSSIHRMQMDHIKSFAGSKRKALFGFDDIVFCRNPNKKAGFGDPTARKRLLHNFANPLPHAGTVRSESSSKVRKTK